MLRGRLNRPLPSSKRTAEAAVAITAGILASSVALTGFGLDSDIEFFAAATVVWQLRGEIAGQERETPAVRLIGGDVFRDGALTHYRGHPRPGDRRPAG